MSIAFITSKRQPKPCTRWDAQDVGRARGVAIALLRGVGTGDDFWKGGDVALHLRRQLSPEEIGQLSPEWMALPAIDEAG